MISKNERKEYRGYPDLFAPKSVKDAVAYGVRYFNAMYADWAGDNGNLLDIRTRRIRENRRYSSGMQSIDKYKQMFIDEQGDMSYTSIDWSIVPIIPKFVDVVQNGIINQEHRVSVESIDRESQDEKYNHKKLIQARMFLKEFSEDFSKLTGIDLSKRNENLPGTEDELELYMDLNYKQAVEISVEEGIDYLFSYCNFEEIKKRVVRDLIDLNEGSVNVNIKGDVIDIRYVDPLYMIRSYTNDPTSSDMYHVGEIRYVTIGELRRMISEDVSEDVLFEIAQKHIGMHGNPGKISKRPIFYELSNSYEHDEFKVAILDGEFLCYNSDTYEKKETKYGAYTFTKKPEGYIPPKNPKYKREQYSDNYEVWYSGKWVIGTDYCFDYGVKSNMIRPYNDKTKVRSSYTVYHISPVDGVSKSLTERMIPFADQIQLAHLQLAQHMAKARPKGVAFNLDALENVMKGDGGTFTPLELQDVLQQTGNLYYRQVQDDGMTPSGTPFQELEGGVGRALQEFIMVYNYNLERIRDVTGLNEMRDGSMPDRDALVGIQKMAVMSSNNATRHIDDAFKFIMKESAMNSTMYIQHVIKYKSSFEYMYDCLRAAIGKTSVDVIDAIDNLPLRHFGIFLEVSPDEVEKEYLEQSIQMALKNQSIELEDASEIRRIKNIKLAERKLKVIREKRRKQKEEESKKNVEMNSQAQQQSVMAKAQADAQLEQVKSQSEIQKLQAEYELKMKLAEMEHRFKMEQLDKQGSDKDRHIQIANSDQDADMVRTRKF